MANIKIVNNDNKSVIYSGKVNNSVEVSVDEDKSVWLMFQ